MPIIYCRHFPRDPPATGPFHVAARFLSGVFLVSLMWALPGATSKTAPPRGPRRQTFTGSLCLGHGFGSSWWLHPDRQPTCSRRRQAGCAGFLRLGGNSRKLDLA